MLALMKTLTLIPLLALLVACGGSSTEPSALPPSPVGSGKKGIGGYNGYQVDALNVAWYYSWGSTPSTTHVKSSTAEFVPMVWGYRGDFTEIQTVVSKNPQATTLLAFNEPDHTDQSNLSVDTAISTWSEFQKTSLRLGSPAATNAKGTWMQNFMTQVEAKSYTVDFMAVHWYGPPDSVTFLSWLDSVHTLYGNRPIWITEFAVADWNATTVANNPYTEAQVLQFMAEVLPALEAMPYVERYAWFPFQGTDAAGCTSALCKSDGVTFTALGDYYRTYAPAK